MIFTILTIAFFCIFAVIYIIVAKLSNSSLTEEDVYPLTEGKILNGAICSIESKKNPLLGAPTVTGDKIANLYIDTNKYNKPYLRPGSIISKIRKCILDANRPLHINEIISLLEKNAAIKGKKAALAYKKELSLKKHSILVTLNSYDKRKKVFIKTAPSTFWLRELEEC